MSNKVVVAGVGMIPFTKPGESEPYAVMGAKAARLAIEDAGLAYRDVQQAYAGYVYGDSTCGQSALYGVGLTGIPIFNVNNNCASGSTALFLARQAVEAGVVECALAVGFEQMKPGALGRVFDDREDPLQRFGETMVSIQGLDPQAPGAAQFFGGAGKEYQDKTGMTAESFAKVSVKARQHAANNPFAMFRTPLAVEQVLASPAVFGVLTRYQCCPPTCGAAAAVVCSEKFARRLGVERPVRILAQALATDLGSTFETRSMIKLVGYDVSKSAAHQVYEAAGLGPADVNVVELHDCFTVNEVLTYEALGLTAEGSSEKFIADGDNTYGGKVVVNPSGGLLSKGHPLGATGLAQCNELVQQLRGAAGPRQVQSAKIALQHNLGLGSACVVTLYGRA